MNPRESWEVCALCREPLDERGDCGLVRNALTHEECAIRAMIGGLNHLLGRCTCCGGTEPPDPPGMTQREAARAAVEFWREREQKLRAAARAACHAYGLPWYDPVTGDRHDPPLTS